MRRILLIACLAAMASPLLGCRQVRSVTNSCKSCVNKVASACRRKPAPCDANGQPIVATGEPVYSNLHGGDNGIGRGGTGAFRVP